MIPEISKSPSPGQSIESEFLRYGNNGNLVLIRCRFVAKPRMVVNSPILLMGIWFTSSMHEYGLALATVLHKSVGVGEDDGCCQS